MMLPRDPSRIRGAAMLVAGCLVAGCGGSPAVHFYTLSPTAATASTVDKKLAIAVGPTEFPRELQRSQVVTRASANQVEVDEFHRWAGSLQLGFVRTLADNLSRLLDTDRVVAYPGQPQFEIDYRVLIDVRQFDGSLGQSVKLRAGWTIVTGTGDVVAVETFKTSQSVTDDTYESLVAAHSAAIEKLSHAIADRLSTQ